MPEPLTYTVVPIDLPLGHLPIEAGSGRPFPSLRLRLDVATLADLRKEPSRTPPRWSLTASRLTADLSDTPRRLVALLQDSQDTLMLGCGWPG